MMHRLKTIAVLIFGVILPFFVLLQAYASMASLRGDVAYTTKIDDLPKYVGEARSRSWAANDYALFSLLYVEHANQKTMINKQQMKTAIVNIGFAVISIGMMLILLGIQGGGTPGLSAGAALNDIRFDLKTGSTGVAVFLVGTIMATLGGVLKNEYQTSKIPKFEPISNHEVVEKHRKALSAYRACSRQSDSLEPCFTQIFFQMNTEDLK